MYEYFPFSPHNGVTIANVLILILRPVTDNFDFHEIIIIIIIISSSSSSSSSRSSII
jgi:hypothetical protein